MCEEESLSNVIFEKQPKVANGNVEHPLPHSAPMHSSVANKPGGLSTNPVVLAHPHVAEVMKVESHKLCQLVHM